MKIDLPVAAPKDIKAGWEGQFEIFSWYDFSINVPTNVFMVTTLKENGAANLQLNAWGMLLGSGSEPKFVMSVMKSSDTYRLIQKNKEFVISIPSYELGDRLFGAAGHYSEEEDEIAAAGFAHEESKLVKVPGVKECFARYECVMDWMKDIEDENVVNVLVQGSIVHAAIDEECFGNTTKETHEKRSLVYHYSEFYNHKDKCCTGNGGLCRLNMEDMK